MSADQQPAQPSQRPPRTEGEVRAWVDGAKDAVWPWTAAETQDEARRTDLFWQGYETALDHLAGFLDRDGEDRA